MGFWAKIAFGFEIAGKVLAAVASLNLVGGVIETPSVRLQIEERVFYVSASVRRAA